MLRQTDPARGVVLPLDARTGELPVGAPVRVPALAVGWRPEPAATGRLWGDVVAAGSELARLLGRVVHRRPGDGTVLDGGLTFRLALPEGFGAEPLLALTDRTPAPVDRAIGPVRLPLASPQPTAPATGASLGLLALTLVVEIAATDVQNRVLHDVTTAVAELAPQCPTSLDARVRAAEETLRGAQTALLDRGTIGEDVALGTAAANLSVLRHQTVALLAGWERVVDGLDRSGTPGSVVRESLGEVGRLGWAGFPGAVHGAYQALVLDARRLLLTAAEQHLRTPERSLTSMRPLVEPDLAARAADVARLRRLLSRLSVTPLSVRKRSGGMLPNLIADAALENSRTQALFTRMANALTPRAGVGSGVHDVEVESRATGDLQILRPL
ncbi:hypothetical protein [Pseudonocardia endophytica]|uniref:Uncharacterized protein n=1 Tax=Pseudonocardia endophytica TaxID=401976 RepID=A0A4R1HKA4_PSEEN|nr:hypothetical protein [Pseudonocardia endophytica]TCK21353.1 hypothetical protein EV378_5334 [Pseudonocardia endophytica]